MDVEFWLGGFLTLVEWTLNFGWVDVEFSLCGR